jgi:predicted DNA-binding transcriptional regulator AlpA
VAQLRERYGDVSHMWIERRLKRDPTFPRPVKLGGSSLRMFDLDQLEQWERACAVAAK